MPTPEVLKAQELVYELRIGEIMSRGLVTVTPETSIREVKNLLRDRRISGLPVIDGEALAGIVTIEDLIRAMDGGDLDVPVAAYMTVQVYTVQAQDSVEQALKKFAQTRVGRLPVVDAGGKPAGIITPDDITRGA